MSRSNLFQLILLAAIWGASFLFIRIGVPVFGPGMLIVLRVGLAALFLFGVALWFKRDLALRGNLRHLLFIGAFNSGLPFLLYAFAAQTLNASLLSIINAATPIFGALVAAIWLRAPLKPMAILGLALGFSGVLLIVGGNAGLHGSQGWIATLAALCAPLCYAVATSYARKHAGHIPAFAQAHGSMWMAALVALPLALATPVPATPMMGDWLAVLVLAVLCTGWAYLIYFRLVSEIGPARTLTVTFLIPVFGVLWGHLFLAEPITPSMILGGAIVLLGTALANGLIGPRSR
jgi:drug/metabolite transporter (DMT)-like permease